MRDEDQPDKAKRLSRAEGSRQVAIGLCWLFCVVGVLDGNGIALGIGVLYAIAAIGLIKRRLWAARIVIILSAVLGATELLLIVLGHPESLPDYQSLMTPGFTVARFVRVVLHIALISLVTLYGYLTKDPSLNTYERDGTV